MSHAISKWRSTWLIHVTHMNGPWHTYEWVRATSSWVILGSWLPLTRGAVGAGRAGACVRRAWDELRPDHAASCYMCDMTRSYVWRDSFTCVTWLFHRRDVTHSYVWRNSMIWVSFVWVDSIIWVNFAEIVKQAVTRVTWLMHMCDMTHSYVLHDSHICVTWLIYMCDMLIHMCDMTPYVWHDSHICVTWLIHVCDMTHSYVRHHM